MAAAPAAKRGTPAADCGGPVRGDDEGAVGVVGDAGITAGWGVVGPTALVVEGAFDGALEESTAEGGEGAAWTEGCAEGAALGTGPSEPHDAMPL